MEDVRTLATWDAVSVNHVLVGAAAEKVASLKARGCLAARAARMTPGDIKIIPSASRRAHGLAPA